ncbi:hypothetical protein [Streptomyces sp. NPDC002490]|uniref:hypothetical protein n=1 Tax=Streptomyces sp. NPDC002490 TaxID=3154416 RepID=UPI00332309F9
MLFSVPDRVWWLTAAAATVLFAVTLLVLLPRPEDAPEEIRARVEQARRQGRRFIFTALPLPCVGIVLGALFGSEPTPVILFVYSVVIGSLPIALLPVRRRLQRSHVAHLQNPGSPSATDSFATFWVGLVVAVSALAAAVLVTLETYGPAGS